MVETVDRRSGSASPEDGKKPEGVKSAPGPAQGGRPLPKPDFLQLVQMFLYQALISLGQAPNPVTQKTETDLAIAKHQIGFLELIEEKTRGNLSETEAKILSECLHQTRLAFVTISKAKPPEAPPKQD